MLSMSCSDLCKVIRNATYLHYSRFLNAHVVRHVNCDVHNAMYIYMLQPHSQDTPTIVFDCLQYTCKYRRTIIIPVVMNNAWYWVFQMLWPPALRQAFLDGALRSFIRQHALCQFFCSLVGTARAS